jgi:hypothetical protein
MVDVPQRGAPELEAELSRYLKELSEDERTRREGGREAAAAHRLLVAHLPRARADTERDFVLALHAVIEEARVDYRRQEHDPENWDLACFNRAQSIVCDYGKRRHGLHLFYRPRDFDDDLSGPNDVRGPREAERPLRPWVRWERPEGHEWIALSLSDTGLEVCSNWDQWWFRRSDVSGDLCRLFWAESEFGIVRHPTDLPLYRGGSVRAGADRFVVHFAEDHRHPQLEAAIDAAPDDAGAAAVWVDWLLLRGDLHGEALRRPEVGTSLVGVLSPLVRRGILEVKRVHGLIREATIDANRLRETRWGLDSLLMTASELRAFDWLRVLRVKLNDAVDFTAQLERVFEYWSPFRRLERIEGHEPVAIPRRPPRAT